MFGCARMLHLTLRSLIFSLCCCRVFSINDPTLPVGLFYPFGEDEGDSVVPIGRFSYSEVQLSKAVAFDQTYYVKLNVESHGLLAFGHRYEGDTPDPFPIIGDRMVAPYWAGTDTSKNTGRVYYRETDDSDLLELATQQFRADLGLTDQMYLFSPQKLFIATWHNVTYNNYGTSSTSVNSFQAILAWSRKQTAVSYRYGKLTWTTGGHSSGGIDGLGGTAAAMGYNSGNDEFYFAHEWSMSIRPDILLLTNNSNVGVVGRYSYRIDRLTNVTDCFENDADADDLCPLPHQRYNEFEGVCYDFAPPFGCPLLTGPIEIPGQKKFEFKCNIVNGSSSINPQAVYEVAFYFNGQVDCTVPSACQDRVSITAGATLSSDGLRGKNKMGKYIGCKVRSYWEGSGEGDKSNYLISSDYYMGLEFSRRSLQVKEDELLPQTILVKSTVPITCTDDTSSTCTLQLQYDVINENAGESNVAFRQRYPGVSPFKSKCNFVIKQSDWKANEYRAYNEEGSLEVMAKFDPFTTGPRTAWLTFHLHTAGTEESIWYGFESPIIEVHHEDVYPPVVKCFIRADPHLTTYDELYYSTHCHGKFYYARNNPGGVGFEVQARHCPCWGAGGDRTISCICGIAIREDRVIVTADTCYNNRSIQYRLKDDHRYECKSDGGCGPSATITKFKLVTPSGNRVYGTLNDHSPSYAYINADILINARFRNVTGLCGSPDGDKKNDWMNADSGKIETIPPNEADPMPKKELVDSWGLGTENSLFENKIHPDLPDIPSGSVGDWDKRLLVNYCQCTRDRNNGRTNCTCGGSAIALTEWPDDPVGAVPKSAGAGLTNDSACSTFLQNTQRCTNNMLGRSRLSSWPTPNGITEEVANETCWNRIMNSDVIGRSCYEMMMNDTETAQQIVNQCVFDVQDTEDFSWAEDKINGLQKVCYYDLITRNNSEVNDTSEAIAQVLADLQEVTAFMCVPVDCSGHGECKNGTCLCDGDYVGSDCGVSKSARPDLRGIISKANLDIRNDSVDGVSLLASDVADTSEMTCKFETSMLNGISKTFTNHGIVTSKSTVVCSIPEEPMKYNSEGLDFTGLHEPGFNFSCLSAGSPVVTYKLSISNDGQTFSSAVVELKLFDSLCFDCDSVTCNRMPNTCIINGYCFADQDINPYNGCEVCDTTVSVSSWTLLPAGNDSCPNVTTCHTDEVCVPDLEFNYDCRSILLFETTESPGSGITNTGTTENSGLGGTTTEINFSTTDGCCGCHGQHVMVQLLAVLMTIIGVYYSSSSR